MSCNSLATVIWLIASPLSMIERQALKQSLLRSLKKSSGWSFSATLLIESPSIKMDPMTASSASMSLGGNWSVYNLGPSAWM